MSDKRGKDSKFLERRTKFGEGSTPSQLNSYNNFVDKVAKNLGVEMGPFGPFKKTKLKKLLDSDKLKDVKKKILKAKGASPGRIKAEFGTEMSRGGEVDVVDLSTEMVIDE